MARFEELDENINKVMMKLIESQNLCKLLYYDTGHDEDPLSKPDIQDMSSLLFDRIYPLPKIPNIEESTSSLLTVFFDEIRLSENINFKGTILSFTILCHIDLWRMPGKLRPYSIKHEIDKIFNEQRVIGIGKMQFERSRFTWANEKYSGYRLDYRIYDFN